MAILFHSPLSPYLDVAPLCTQKAESCTMSFRFVYHSAEISVLSRSLETAEIYLLSVAYTVTQM